MEQIAGHTFDISWASGIPVVRSRQPVSGYGAQALANSSGSLSCSGNYPILNTQHDSSGNLSWSVSNVNNVSLQEYCVGGCSYNANGIPYEFNPGYYGPIIYPEVINNTASGYQESSQQGCAYSVIASNKCCGHTEGCAAPNCCMYHREIMPLGVISGVSIIDYGITNDSNYDGLDDITGDFCKDYSWICWTTIGAYGSGQVLLNGQPVEQADCLLLPYGSSRERNYQLSVTTDCGTVALCNFETPCCSRKDYYILQVDGFVDLDYTIDNPNFNYQCLDPLGQPGNGFSSGSTTMTIRFDLSKLNGTYIIPLCHQTYGNPYGYVSSCGTESIDTGIEVTAIWTRNQTWRTNITNFNLGCFFNTITDGIENNLFSVKFKVYAHHTGLYLGDGIVHNDNYSIYHDQYSSNCNPPSSNTRGPYAGNSTESYQPYAGCDYGVGDYAFRIVEFPKCDHFPGYGVSSYNINGVYDFALAIFGSTSCYRQLQISCPGGFSCYGNHLNPAPECLINQLLYEIHPLTYSIDLL